MISAGAPVPRDVQRRVLALLARGRAGAHAVRRDRGPAGRVDRQRRAAATRRPTTGRHLRRPPGARRRRRAHRASPTGRSPRWTPDDAGARRRGRRDRRRAARRDAAPTPSARRRPRPRRLDSGRRGSRTAWATSARSTTRAGCGSAAASRTRVPTADGPLYTEPCEEVFNTHPPCAAPRWSASARGPPRARAVVELRRRRPPDATTSRGRACSPSPPPTRRRAPCAPSCPTARFPSTSAPQREDRPREAGPLGRRAAGDVVKALVTGGGGFLGGAVVDALLARGDEVRASPAARTRRSPTGVSGCSAATSPTSRPRARPSPARTSCSTSPRRPASGAPTPTSTAATSSARATCSPPAARRASAASSTPARRASCTPAATSPAATSRLPYATHFDCRVPAHEGRAPSASSSPRTAPTLATAALRPHLIWGPGDTQLVPRILARARAGRLALVGDGSAVIDTTYIDDAARAHLDAADALAAPGAACAGGRTS